jgi:putative oxidoreductase
MLTHLPSYPGGAAGVGLLIARVVLATLVLLVCAVAVRHVELWGWVVAGVAALLNTCGFLSRWACALAAASVSVQLDTPVISGGMMGALAVVGTATALCLLGPGAYSVDAMRFGRKVFRLRS